MVFWYHKANDIGNLDILNQKATSNVSMKTNNTQMSKYDEIDAQVWKAADSKHLDQWLADVISLVNTFV